MFPRVRSFVFLFSRRPSSRIAFLFIFSCSRDEFFARTCALRSSPPVLPPKMGDGVFGSSVGSVHFGFSGAAAGASFSSARTTTLARLFPALPLRMRRVALVGAQATVCMALCFVVGGAANDFFPTDQMTIDTFVCANPDPLPFRFGWVEWEGIHGTPTTIPIEGNVEGKVS